MDILIVGDLHGDWGKLNQLLTVKKPDIVLQVGDFGWWPQMEIETTNAWSNAWSNKKKWNLNGIKTKSPIYWCDGNHEEFPYLNNLQNNKIHKMYDNVFYCSRGSTLELPDGRIILFAGGADSYDKNLRTPGYDWFPEENITNKQLDKMLSYDKIDIIISHTCPSEFDIYDGADEDKNRFALDEILYKYDPSSWFFGHWHREKSGIYNKTKWTGLNYPGGYSGRWWTWLKD